MMRDKAKSCNSQRVKETINDAVLPMRTQALVSTGGVG